MSDRHSESITLTAEQQAAIDFALENLGAGTIAIAGPAGSGKSTLIRELTDQLPGQVTVSAMTNKARHVLQTKGFDGAVTLHQAALRPLFKPPLDKLENYLSECRHCGTADPSDCKHVCSCLEPGKCPIHGDETARIARQLGVTPAIAIEAWEFYKESGIYAALRHLGIRDVFRYIQSWQPALPQDGILIVDEASMLGSSDLETVQRVFKKIILVGDEYQLPPVKSEPIFWTIPTRTALTHIHRQVEGSQPLQIATKLRNGESVTPRPLELIDLELCRAGMPIIVWRNRTRVELTKSIRDRLGLGGKPPQPGETLICRNGSDKSGKARGLFNNSLWRVVEAAGWTCTLENDAGELLEREPVYMEELDAGPGLPFRFAYCLTCHNSQGSEWPSVRIHLPDVQGLFAMHKGRGELDDARRWLYTAATRAKERVIWVGDK